MNKFVLYRFIAPFRSLLQDRLRKRRLDLDSDGFVSAIGASARHAEIAISLWDVLRELAFVSDFRPTPDDDLSTVYAMGPEEVRDDVIEPLFTKLGLSTRGIDFTGFDFSSITTPRDVCSFLMKITDMQSAEEGTGSRID